MCDSFVFAFMILHVFVFTFGMMHYSLKVRLACPFRILTSLAHIS